MALTTNLIGYWKCNEDSWNGTANEVKDSSGNARHGVRSGNATTAASGVLGRCGTFDGAGDYVTTGTMSDLSNTKAVSVQCWVKELSADDYKTERQQLKLNQCFVMDIGRSASPTPHFVVCTDTWILSPAGTDISGGSWHHLVGTYDGSYVRIYVDGSEVGTGTAQTNSLYTNTGNGVMIGGLDASYLANGNIDEIAVWSRVLSGAEVTTLYNSGAGYNIMDIVSASASASPSISPSVSKSPSMSPSVSKSPSVSPSVSVSPSLSKSPSVSPSASVSPSVSKSPSVSPSVSKSPSVSPSASVSPSVSKSPSVSPSLSKSPSVSPSVSKSPSVSPSVSVSPSLSKSPSVSPSPKNWTRSRGRPFIAKKHYSL